MRGLPADDRPPLGQQLWQRGVDRGRRLSFALRRSRFGSGQNTVGHSYRLAPGPASPIPGRLISPVFGRPATPPSWPLAPATPRPPFSKPAPSFNAMMERRCASAMRCCWARIHECRSLSEIRNATLAHPHRCGDFDAAARRFDAQIQVFDGFARQVQMDAINIQRLPGGSGPNGFRRTGLRSGGLTTAIRHASHSRTTADNDGGPPGT